MSKSIFETNEINKSVSFKQNKSLNDVISQLSDLLKPIQYKKEREYKENKMPIGFIIGNPRSGTTLILQWLVSLGIFSYPTNVLNRFAYAPYIGALIQNMLFNSDFDFHNEFDDLKVISSFESNLGKTKGALSPSEFQHFFRNYMPNFDPEYLDNNNLSKVDFQGIKSGLASIEHVFGKPFILKNVMLQYNLLGLFSHIPNSIFIHIKRNPIYNMQSLLLARENYYSDRNIWWSVKPKEYNELIKMNIYHQIAGQVYYTNKSISKELSQIPINRKVIVRYEEFCMNPEETYDKIIKIYRLNGYNIEESYKSNVSYSANNSIKLSKEDINKFKSAYKYFQNK